MSLTRPSETLVVVGRVGVASVIAGGIALLIGNGHVYWAASFACLVLHQGGTRLAQTYRGVHRIIGTAFGLVFFAGLHTLNFAGTWWLVLAVLFLQFSIEMLVVRNYGLAVMFITPLALTIAGVGTGGVHTVTTVGDRLLDTVIAVAVALGVLWATGRGSGVPLLRGQARRCIHAVEAVLTDLAADPTHQGGLDSVTALENRRHLYFETLELQGVATRTRTDEPALVAPYEPMSRAVSELAFLVLGACWHPHLRQAPELFADARHALAPLTAHPVSRHRDADDLHDDVLAVRRVITEWRTPD